MPVFIAGLPLHVLAVHAVVVLVPLAVLGCVAVAVRPAVRLRFGWLVVGLTAAATASIPIATGSGEDLRDRLVPTDLIREHAHLGDELLVFVAFLLIAVTTQVWFGARRRADDGTGPRRVPAKPVMITLAVLTVVLSAVSAVQVVRIGDSGARAAWADKQYTAPQHQRG